MIGLLLDILAVSEGFLVLTVLVQQSLAQYVTDLFEKHLEELERKGMLPKGK
jgi:hypothetical protein